MDIVLEVFDTYGFDYIYSAFLPARPAPYNLNGGNSTLTSQSSTWQYKPSTEYFSLTPSEAAYQSSWVRDDPYRQATSLFLITWIFGLIIYFIFASLSYVFIFDKAAMKHPKFLKNQVSMEIAQTAVSLPIMAIFTVPFFLAEVLGYSKLYDRVEDAPAWWYNILQFPMFLLFTDFWIYVIHRALHHKILYKTLHKPHHKWIVPTPYASHAFHPIDGFSQSVPYHVFPFIFPLQKFAYIFFFVFINVWTIMIHDGEYIATNPLINGAANHTLHHYFFRCNYGQYTTLWDRLGGSYRKPNPELFEKEQKMGVEHIKKATEEVERVLLEEEGKDDRSYDVVERTKKEL